MALGWRRTPADCRCRPRYLPPPARRTSTRLRVASRITPCSRRRPRRILSKAGRRQECILSKAGRRQECIRQQGGPQAGRRQECILSKARRRQRCIRRRARRRQQPCIHQRALHPMRHRIRRPLSRRSSRPLSRRKTISTKVKATTSRSITPAAAGTPAQLARSSRGRLSSALAHYRQLDEAGIGAAIEYLDGRFLVVSGLGEEDVADIALRISVVHAGTSLIAPAP